MKRMLSSLVALLARWRRARSGGRGVEHDVFLSYSHKGEASVAPRLRKALQRVGTPFYKPAALDVYVDQANLAATAALWPLLREELAASRYLVLLASPAAAASGGVAKEIATWIELGRVDRLLIALTAGTIAWDERRADFDWSRTTALPRVLTGSFGHEPKIVDLRRLHARRWCSRRGPAIRHAICEIAAPIKGMPLVLLLGEERKRRRSLAMMAAALIVLLAASGVTAWRSGQAARESRRLDLSRRLAERSRVRLADDLQLSLLMAVEAMSASDTAEARRALYDALTAVPYLTTILTRGAARVSFSPDGRRLAAIDDDDRLHVWSTAPVRELFDTVLPEQGINRLALGIGDWVMLGADPRGRESDTGSWLARASIAAGLSLGPKFFDDTAPYARMTLSGDRVATIGADGRLRVWQTSTGALEATLAAPDGVKLADGAFAAGGERIVAVGEHGRIVAGSSDGRGPRAAVQAGSLGLRRVAIDERGQRIAAGARAKLVRAEMGETLRVLPDEEDPDGLDELDGAVSSLSFDATGEEIVVFTQAGSIERREWATGKRAARRVRIDFDQSSCAQLSIRAQFLAACGRDRTLRLHDLERPASLAAAPTIRSRPGFSISTTADARRILVGDHHGRLQIVDLDEAGPRSADLQVANEELSVRAALAADGVHAVVLSDDGSLRMWNLADGTSLELAGARDGADTGSLRLVGNGVMAVAMLAEKSLVAFDLATGQRIDTTRVRLSAPVTGMSLDGAGRLAVAVESGEVALWSLATGCTSPLAAATLVQRPTGVAISGDGRVLAVDDGIGDRVRLFSFAHDGGCTAGRLAPMFDVARDRGSSTDLAFDRDGRLLAIRTDNGSVILLDVEAREPLGHLFDEGGLVGAMSFDPGGGLLVALTLQGISVRDVNVARWRDRACRMARRNLSCSEWGDAFPGVPYRATCPLQPANCGADAGR